jgi:hypothetical protein
MQLDGPLPLRSEGHSLRGPPQLSTHEKSLDHEISDCIFVTLASTAVTSESGPRDPSDSNNDDIDDREVDDDSGHRASDWFGRASLASHRGQTWILIPSEFNNPLSFVSDGHSLRAPPR